MTQDRFTPIVTVLALTVGLAIGLYSANIVDEFDRLELAIYLNKCDYKSHGISDLAWEVYREGLTSSGPAYVSTRMVMSANIPAAECLRTGPRAVPTYWKDND